MKWDELDEMFTGSDLTWRDLLASFILIVVGFGLSYLIGPWRQRRLGRSDGQSQQVVGMLARVAQVLVIAVFAGWALTRLGADIGLLTLMVVVAVVIAVLAARLLIEGMAAGAALSTRPAFDVGDEIEVDEVVGEVIEITNRSTVIRQRDATMVYIPNVNMLEKTVRVFTVDRDRRSAVDVTIGFEADIDHAETVLRSALADIDTITRIGSIRFWHQSGLQSGNDARDDAVRTIKTTLEEERIRLAPTAEVAAIDSAARTSS